MTGGVIAVLGSTGRNVGAGMTGGIAFIFDEDGDLEEKVNKEIVGIHNLTSIRQEELLQNLIKEHIAYTKSHLAGRIINNWNNYKLKFKILVPPSEEQRIGINREIN